MYTVRTPVGGYTGDGYGLHFVNGAAQTDNKRIAAYLYERGYTVEDDSGMTQQAPPQSEPSGGEILDAMKSEADSLGIKYHWNIGADKLREQIAEYKSQNEMT